MTAAGEVAKFQGEIRKVLRDDAAKQTASLEPARELSPSNLSVLARVRYRDFMQTSIG